MLVLLHLINSKAALKGLPQLNVTSALAGLNYSIPTTHSGTRDEAQTLYEYVMKTICRARNPGQYEYLFSSSFLCLLFENVSQTSNANSTTAMITRSSESDGRSDFTDSLDL